MVSEDKVVPSEPMNAEDKLQETTTDCEDPRDGGSDRNRLRHHPGDEIGMEDC
uniref:Uncharacterized protein n=1 Tax=Peronospora matthiolae TaxID=2874970 RepID=A0AAV1THR6_9STRA